MKIAYRSASKFRRQTSLLSRLYSATVHAAMTLVCLAETTGLSHVLLAILAAAVAVILAPMAGILLLVMEIYPKVVHQAALMTKEDDDEEPGCVEKRPTIRTTLDSSKNPGIMNVLAVAMGPPNIATVRQRATQWIENRSRDHHLKDTLETKFGCYTWKACHNFDINNHVLQSPSETTETNLPRFTTELCSYSLQRRLPPWQVVIVPFLQRSDSHAIIFRFHHLLSRFFDTSSITYIAGGSCIPSPSIPEISTSTIHVNYPSSWTLQLKEVVKTLHLVFNLPLELLRVLLDPSPVQRPRSIPKEDKSNQAIAWSEAIPLDLIDKIKQQAGTTAHDILLTCICGALRHYFTMTAGRIPDDVLGILPVYQGPSKEPVGFRTLVLPLEEADTLARLTGLHRRLAAAKKQSWKFRSSILIVQYLTRVLPSAVARLLVEVATRDCSVIISNEKVSYPGSNVGRMFHWKTPPANIGLSLTLVQYSNTVTLTAVACLSALQRPDILVSCFIREVHDLALTLGVRQERRPLLSPNGRQRGLM